MRDLLADLLLTMALYIGLSLFTYGLRHPQMTELQILNHWREALTWAR